MKKNPEKSKDGFVEKVWKICGSSVVMFILLGAIVVASVVGAVIPTEWQQYVFQSFWFVGLLFVFALNLAICCVDRIFTSRKKIASIITHSAVLLILLGSLVSYVWGGRGMLDLEEGQDAQVFMTDKAEVKHLGFSVKLDDFSLLWHDVSSFEIWVKIIDKNIKVKQPLVLNQKFEVPGSGYAVTVIDYKPDFMMDENHAVITQSQMPNNPAVLVRIVSATGTEDRWVFAKHAEFGRPKDENCKVLFMFEPQIKQYRSTVTVTDKNANVVFSKAIQVNHPLSYKGFTFYQIGYDEQRPNWTNLEVVFDPGAKIVFVGFIFLNIGMIVMFLSKFFARKQTV
jgi:cytochrome c biogenesis protein ResB